MEVQRVLRGSRVPHWRDIRDARDAAAILQRADDEYRSSRAACDDRPAALGPHSIVSDGPWSRHAVFPDPVVLTGPVVDWRSK
mmetsp:Transcript_25925/g.51660  ORF Transcript_25925/g.51660 Transcript_25925/m.51660 type:complete len:83 (+) Transcript_25925:3-251(+)